MLELVFAREHAFMLGCLVLLVNECHNFVVIFGGQGCDVARTNPLGLCLSGWSIPVGPARVVKLVGDSICVTVS